MRDYLTTDEAAQLCGYHINYIRKLARTGRVKAAKKGVWLFQRDDFIRYMEEMKALGPEKFNRFRDKAVESKHD
ncbi:MAG: helix-turn-helix domain-containing protein [Chloroflexota bacterium]|nr:helix-turn-helix domain-containing protein [Chloroflexota bacterium]